MFKNLTKFLCSIICFSLVVSCSDNRDAEQSKLTIAQWGSEKYLIYLPLYIAEEAGFFAEQGLEVSISFSGNDDQVFAKVLRGDAQFGVGDPIFAAVSRQQGADGIVVATIVDRVSLWGVSKNSEVLLDPSDFEGLRIGTFPQPSTTYTLLNDTINSNDLKTANIIEVPIGNELALLEADAADVVMLLEPAASIAEKAGYSIVTSFPEIWGRFAFTGLTSTETYTESNPETVKKVFMALNKAVALAHNDRSQTYDIAASLFPTLERDVVVNAVDRMLDDETIPKSVTLDEDAWISSVQVRQRVGDVEEGFICTECLLKVVD